MTQRLIISSAVARPKNPTGVLIDSGAEICIFRDADVFSSWDYNFKHGEIKVILADGTICTDDIQGAGRVVVQVTDEKGNPHIVDLPYCLFMPSLDHAGIISINDTTKLGYRYIFDEGESHMIYKKKVTIPFRQAGKLYFVNAARHLSTPPLKRRTYHEWHQILGHLNYDALDKMPKVSEGMIFSDRKRLYCRECVENKAQSYRSRLPDERSVQPFEFVHSDIHQPLNQNHEDQEDGAFKYIVVFVCDYTGYLKVYPI